MSQPNTSSEEGDGGEPRTIVSCRVLRNSSVQWRAAGPALAEVRRRELREMTDEQALVTVLALLDLRPHLPPKTGGSGLVEQQRLLALATR